MISVFINSKNNQKIHKTTMALVITPARPQLCVDDDKIHHMLRRFPKTCRVVMVMDCWHSGTICDLSYNQLMGQSIRSFIIRDEGGNASTNNITVTASESDTIYGSGSTVLSIDDSTKWFLT